MTDYKNIYRVELAVEEEIKTVRLRCNNGWDSLRVTYNNDGLMQIFSSFGNYAYYWGSMGCDTMAEFWKNASRSRDYFSNKLWDSERPKKRLDADLFKKQFIEEYKIDVDLDDKVIEELDSLISEYGQSRDRLFDHWNDFEYLVEYDSWDVYEHNFGMVYTGSYKTLRDEIVPIIAMYFDGTLDKYNKELTEQFPDLEKTV